jgi:ubiquinone/menaquinone biosynthesis C-methylase UbiE
MEPLRKPFQGVLNIIRFNYQWYVLTGLVALTGILVTILKNPFEPAFRISFVSDPFWSYLLLLSIAITILTIFSLLVSFYIYDFSGLYTLNWMKNYRPGSKIVNINAGFDEISDLLQKKYPDSELTAMDFYDEEKHTEVSIKRAREAYPPHPGIKQISTKYIPLEDNSINSIFLFMAAHEIRNNTERVTFFNELRRALSDSGKIIVTEHLRDLPNFIAYNIGFFHFHSYATWKKTFVSSGLIISEEIKITPFITTFVLQKNGNTL